MRILYVASDQVVPGRTGGSVHVLEVSRGLAARGHEVHAVVHRRPGSPNGEESDGVRWHRIEWSPPHRVFRFRAYPAVRAIAEAVHPDVLMERYYNFGGEGIRVAAEKRIPSLLEVNSPVVDHPGSVKGALDALTLVRPLRRYREALCRRAAALVAPIPEIVPAFARAKTEAVTWGANVEAFRPDVDGGAFRRSLGVSPETTVVVFSGSFRPWHGVQVLEEAARRLVHREDLFFLLAGGPRPEEARGYRGRHLGAVAYAAMPSVLAAGDVGVAPYDTARLAQLRLGFYWSPLKIFEYMAAGLPAVTIPRFPLTDIVRDGQEGCHFREGDPGSLAETLVRLAADPVLRRTLGRKARVRVVERYSWAHHCQQLEAVLQRVAS